MKYLMSMLTLMLLVGAWGGSTAQAKEGRFELEVAEAGSDILVTVRGIGLADVYAYELRLQYDKSRMRLVNALNGMPGGGMSVSPIVEQSGIRLAHTKTGRIAGESGNFALATMQFQRIATGAAELRLHEVRLVDSGLNRTIHTPEAAISIVLGQLAIEFTDIEGHWAEQDIRLAAASGWIEGYGDGSFRPDRPVNRAELAVMLAKAMELPGALANIYNDESRIPTWARPHVGATAAGELLTGYEDRTFRAANLVTRTEAAAVAARAAHLPIDPHAVPGFADRSEISPWALPLVAAAESAGLVMGRGEGRFAPDAAVTRAEIVALINRVLSQIEAVQKENV